MFAFVVIQPCYAKKAVHVPALLQPWVDWVLHDKEKELACIPQYNDGSVFYCSWPSALEVTLNDQGGKFSQSWLVHHQGWVELPGSSRQWPQDVLVDGESQVIIQKNNRPRIHLQPGAHTISGRFTWPRLPENLQIPASSALVVLTVNNEKIAFPNLDESGRLWLKRSQVQEKIENRLKIENFRLIDDSIPSQVLLYLTLDVAGAAREIKLGPIYNPQQFTPLSLKSSLPAKLEQDAKMRLQVRPGQFSLRLILRHNGPLQALSFRPPEDGFWPRQEIWSFRAQPDLRLVEISGVPSIDPLQAAVPSGWKNYPAYRMLPGETMRFKEIKRGDPEPAPDQLTLERRLWLRFDGSGYTIQDDIKGRKNTNWRLEMAPAITLGRVAVDGIEQFITRRQGSDKAGVELRNGILNITAESLYKGKIKSLPATGWDHDFQQVKGRLHLPPGWKLLNATGFDRVSRTWIKQWTLLDFFIVLVFTIAVAKIFSKPLAGIAFLTLILIYHEPGAPRYVWLALLLGYTLLKYLPEGKFRKVVKAYQFVAILVLVIIVIPYAIESLRIGIFPQLARPHRSMTDYATSQRNAAPIFPQTDDVLETDAAPMEPTLLEKQKRTAFKKRTSGSGQPRYGARVMQYDPQALTQTGPGMPKWYPFETVHFSWSGPVTRDQSVSFALIGPKANLVLAFLRVLFIIVLALGMFGLRYRPKGGFHLAGLKSFISFSFLAFLILNPGTAQSTEIPSAEVLKELQERLLEKDECYPACADISDATITISPNLLSMSLGIDAHLDTAVPIPGHVKQWLPQRIMIDDNPARGLLRQKNGLWMLVPAGKHIVKLSGLIRRQNTLQLPFALKPHRVSIKADGWSVEGVHPDGTFEAQLQFRRIVDQTHKQAEILETGILPPFASVERTILLGLVWKVKTKVRRISPTGSAIVLDIPLIPGESVTTEGVRVSDGAAKVNLQADQKELGWESFLEPADQILLKHKKNSDWTEIWKVDVSPIFHLEYEGIPVILHKTGVRWHPTWHPWPGETVKLNISRPGGIKGQTLTIEQSHLRLHPGHKTTAASILLSIKSSQGGQHTIVLPAEAKLQEVIIRGKIQPIHQDGRNVSLPITPGQQHIALKWLEPKGMTMRYRSSAVDLGAQSVNASVDIHLPRNRWPLFVGGEQLVGPAVLFWSVIIIIALVAFGLSKTRWTPLKIYHWFLLGIGMSMSNLAGGLVVTGWLIALNFRKKATSVKGRKFNLMQIGIVVLTIAALGSLVFAISRGLLGHPDMNIIGNGSISSLLRWYQDVSDHQLPRAWVFSIPMLAYRIAMLAWALWISFWLVGILKWGWQQFTSSRVWDKLLPKVKKTKGPGPDKEKSNGK